jgi:hypothetical protein
MKLNKLEQKIKKIVENILLFLIFILSALLWLIEETLSAILLQLVVMNFVLIKFYFKNYDE